MQAQTPEVSAEKATTPDELLPCPFCGLAPTEHDQIGYSSVKCRACKFSIKVKSQDGPPYAPELWNRRAAPVAHAAVSADTARLDFMLEAHRKVIVELIPGRRYEVYVEEGFMADVQYPSITHAGDWANGSSIAKDVKRKAIDAAIDQQQGGAA
ncbi:Lar family restriction alleviation protein [Stutzerimonas nitrititolerans]|uniref:Lar family restriction alleviation protein n=1 Tax=Stutzerimonas nitrititolerans TaxID=2482751 RepID=UPI0028A98F47|nr:Lar family restriction alleviation protein [Stutzerimonas nitrititolerans]